METKNFQAHERIWSTINNNADKHRTEIKEVDGKVQSQGLVIAKLMAYVTVAAFAGNLAAHILIK